MIVSLQSVRVRGFIRDAPKMCNRLWCGMLRLYVYMYVCTYVLCSLVRCTRLLTIVLWRGMVLAGFLFIFHFFELFYYSFIHIYLVSLVCQPKKMQMKMRPVNFGQPNTCARTYFFAHCFIQIHTPVCCKDRSH